MKKPESGPLDPLVEAQRITKRLLKKEVEVGCRSDEIDLETVLECLSAWEKERAEHAARRDRMVRSMELDALRAECERIDLGYLRGIEAHLYAVVNGEERQVDTVLVASEVSKVRKMLRAAREPNRPQEE